MAKSKVFVAVPAFGHNCSAHTMASLVDLVPPLMVKGIWGGLSTLTYPDIAELRNMFLTLWYDQIQSSHILFVDADMSFPFQLVLDMINFDAEVTGCLYPKKTIPISFVGRPKDNAPEAQREAVMKTDHGNFMEVEGVGFGVTLVSRKSVDRILENNFADIDNDFAFESFTGSKMLASFGVKRLIRAFDSVKTERGRLSEDLSYCWRQRQAGGKVWASIDHAITHVGQYGYTGKYSDLLFAGIEAKDERQLELV